MQNNMVAVVPQCGSSNVIGGTTENIGNYSFNGSASGSNHGSNEQNGSSTAANNGAANIESDNVTSGKSGTDDGSDIRLGGIEQNRSAQREAALTTFRQKQLERCYEKKVHKLFVNVDTSQLVFAYQVLIVHNVKLNF